MRNLRFTAIAIVATLLLVACGSDDSGDDAGGQGNPIPTDAVDENGNFVEPEAVDESASITVAGETYDLVIEECHLRESGPLANTVFPDPDTALFSVTLNSDDEGLLLIVKSEVDDPDVPPFVAGQARFMGSVSDLDFSSDGVASTYSGSNITIEDQGTGDPLTIEHFEVTCEASDF